MAKKQSAQAPNEEKKSEFNQFLRATDIGGLGERAMLSFTGFNHNKPNGTYGPEIVCEVRLPDSEKYFDFSIREGSPNHRKLFRAFGSEINRWRGPMMVEIQLSAQGRAFVAVLGGEAVPF